MNDSRKQKLLKKIRDLLDLSADKNSIHEAEAAAKMAQRLIMKYNIEEAEVYGSEPNSMEKTLYPLWEKQINNEGTWLRTLYSVVAQYNFCKVVLTKRPHNGKLQDYVYILGESANVEMVKYLTEQLMARFRSIESKIWDSYTGPDKRNTYRRGFLKGCAAGIARKFKEQQDQFNKDEQSKGLILRKDAQVVEFMKQEFPSLGKSKRSSTTSDDGFSKGYATGKSISINQGVRGKGGSLQIGN